MHDGLMQITPLSLHQYYDSVNKFQNPAEVRRLHQLHEVQQAREATHPLGLIARLLARFASGVAARQATQGR